MHIRALIVALTVLSGCSSLPPASVSHDIFDEHSGVTLSVVNKPLVFARGRTDVAAHARDYVTLVAIETDRSGDYHDYLLLYRWSTVDRRMSAPPDAGAGLLRILTDGRAIDLTPLDEVPVSVSPPELLAPKHADAVIRAYAVDVATLRYIAMSRELNVRLPQEALDVPFKLWSDGRVALGQFAGSPIGAAR